MDFQLLFIFGTISFRMGKHSEKKVSSRTTWVSSRTTFWFFSLPVVRELPLSVVQELALILLLTATRNIFQENGGTGINPLNGQQWPFEINLWYIYIYVYIYIYIFVFLVFLRLSWHATFLLTVPGCSGALLLAIVFGSVLAWNWNFSTCSSRFFTYRWLFFATMGKCV